MKSINRLGCNIIITPLSLSLTACDSGSFRRWRSSAQARPRRTSSRSVDGGMLKPGPAHWHRAPAGDKLRCSYIHRLCKWKQGQRSKRHILLMRNKIKMQTSFQDSQMSAGFLSLFLSKAFVLKHDLKALLLKVNLFNWTTNQLHPFFSRP